MRLHDGCAVKHLQISLFDQREQFDSSVEVWLLIFHSLAYQNVGGMAGMVK